MKGRMLLKMGINSPVRAVVVLPPPNVWCHLAAMSSDFKANDPSMWGLLCLKPIYGLNNAYLAWQLCLREYLQQIKGAASSLDENSWRWKRPDGSLLAACTCHVDDLAVAAPQDLLDQLINTTKPSWGSSRKSVDRLCRSNTAEHVMKRCPMATAWCRACFVPR